ncbi:hypothetical protein J3Q64DRAFT_1746515 [Phycomyces blakesleeanus]|uniref:Uncharacterized protein n=2 Tax=Phycomyces blakesleeanus TaxID=4837 RepID=A0A162X2Y2_PHYB8|nr:hypothetical protein PHYBLDRAFT_65700 [Phycomyces blakesleeanus NRRL 1555(-)]OAD72255.1 hypothetical protein PHYBLDRAFT_65700 [Phycomyces blakesleeanus NRRL 1555(-)]|eukprot:XP_018290295.1 hypothetical protein PHYBLDRAFT_65700 [Phycomyces blakesleeanus NRRL 1555(-)]
MNLFKRYWLAICLTIALLSVIDVTCSTVTKSVPTPKDILRWTRYQLSSYLDTHKILYDKHADDASLIDTVKAYKDAAESNAKFFGERVEGIVDGIKIQLEKESGLKKVAGEALLSHLQHILRRLELKGELSWDRVQDELEQKQVEFIKHRIMTDAQWKKFVLDVSQSFQNQTWYQKLSGKYPTDFNTASSSLHKWLHKIGNRLAARKDMTHDQIFEILDHIKQAVVSNDTNTLGDKTWLEELAHRIESMPEVAKENVQSIVDSIEQDITAFKIFASDYIQNTIQETNQAAIDIKDSVKSYLDSVRHRFHWVLHNVESFIAPHLWPIQSHEKFKNSRAPFTTTITSAKVISTVLTLSTTSTAPIGAVVPTPIGSTDLGCKRTFANYWYDVSWDALRQLGYTEVQINWIQRNLALAFQNSNLPMTDERIDQALELIRIYLTSNQVEPPHGIRSQIEKIRQLFTKWTHLKCEKDSNNQYIFNH